MVLLLILILGLRVRGIFFLCGSAIHAKMITLTPKLQISHLLLNHFRVLNLQLLQPQLLLPLYFSHFLLKVFSAEENYLLTSRSLLTCIITIRKSAPPAAADCAFTTRLVVLTATDILHGLGSFLFLLLYANRSSLNPVLHDFEDLTADIPVADGSVDLLQ